MDMLRVYLFGGFRLVQGDEAPESRVPRTVQALLAFLLLYRHRCHPREMLADLFWGEFGDDRARSCFNTALWRLRCVLEPAGTSRGTFILASAAEVGFNPQSHFWLDVATFEEQAHDGLTKPVPTMVSADVDELEGALKLYCGELLEGFYDDWAIRERERLRLLYLNSLAHLMDYHKLQRAYEASLAYGRQILDLDPLREEVHREMMRLYVLSGQRALAVRQYEMCRDIVATELGILPMEETQMLYRQITQDVRQQRVADITAGERSTLRQALQQLQAAMDALATAQSQLQHVVQLVEQLRASREG